MDQAETDVPLRVNLMDEALAAVRDLAKQEGTDEGTVLSQALWLYRYCLERQAAGDVFLIKRGNEIHTLEIGKRAAMSTDGDVRSDVREDE